MWTTVEPTPITRTLLAIPALAGKCTAADPHFGTPCSVSLRNGQSRQRTGEPHVELRQEHSCSSGELVRAALGAFSMSEF